MSIPIEHEDVEELRKWGMGIAELMEDCYFCKNPTRYWFTEKNQPVCPDCAESKNPGDVKAPKGFVYKE